MAIFQNTVSIKKLGRVCSCDAKSGTHIDCKLVFCTTERVEICLNRIFCRFYGTFPLNFNCKKCLQYLLIQMTAKPNQLSLILASYMMEVEDDNVYIGGDVSGNSGPDRQSEEKFYGFASMDVLLGKYYELQIKILTSGRSDIEKINRKKCKIHSDENRYVPICYYKLSRDFCVKY